ncbi:RluA family pseudouridine synthase [Geobacter pelophilus]|uniref:RluA family pseudouridine synthase n=1 Tax=Geoanaerobacter pelophilus TaxID=60036 RepID=A0AAW4KZD4_9BACT|nr:RluA family pseudouridine synthase [Geoanaerobacter pelophilus]MBT0664006.1 RluA family pseudouridine synthase [Geoanaerobacter pelophilus]
MILLATAGKEQQGVRLDDGLKALFPQLSKTEIRRLLDWGSCTVNMALVRVASRQLHQGDAIALGLIEKERCIDLVYTAADMLYEDQDCLAINKGIGINSQRTPYQLKGTAEYAVGCYLRTIGLNEEARIVHRLDRGTSGVLVFPKNKKTASYIAGEFKAGRVEKVYWAVVSGSPAEDSWQVNAPIGKLNKFRYAVMQPGKDSVTDFRVIARGDNAALIEAKPLTGRTHQIRVHLAHSGLPIIGDVNYGAPPAERIMLHCRRMAFKGPSGQPVQATAPIDNIFLEICSSHGIAIDKAECGLLNG